MTYGPDLCREVRCRFIVLEALRERWEYEDKRYEERIRLEESRRRLARHMHFGEATFIIGLTFMALGYGLASVGAPDDTVLPYLGIGILLATVGIIVIVVLALYGWTKLVDRVAERAFDYLATRKMKRLQ